MHAHVQYVRVRRKLLGFVTCGSRESNSDPQGWQQVPNHFRPLAGLFQARVQVFLGGGSFSTGVSAYEVQGALQTAPGLLRPKASVQ